MSRAPLACGSSEPDTKSSSPSSAGGGGGAEELCGYVWRTDAAHGIACTTCLGSPGNREPLATDGNTQPFLLLSFPSLIS